MISLVGFLIGALVGTFLFSRLVLFAIKCMGYNAGRLLLGHAACFLSIAVIGGYGFADDGPPQFIQAGLAYILPQLFWLTVDLVRWRRGWPLIWGGKYVSS